MLRLAINSLVGKSPLTVFECKVVLMPSTPLALLSQKNMKIFTDFFLSESHPWIKKARGAKKRKGSWARASRRIHGLFRSKAPKMLENHSKTIFLRNQLDNGIK